MRGGSGNKEVDELVAKCNEFMRKLQQMDEEERDKYVEEVLDWLLKMYDELLGAVGGEVKSLKDVAKLKKRIEIVRQQVEKRKHVVIVCLTYAVKEKFQKKFAPLFVSLFSLV